MKLNAKIENWPIFISLFSGALLSASIIYDYGYFTYLGFSFAEAPTTISDHIRSSLIWFPSALGAVFVIFLYESTMTRLEGGMTEEEIIETSPTPRFTKWFRNSPVYIVYVAAFSTPVLWYFGIEIPMNAYFFSVVIIWFVFHNWIYNHPNIAKKASWNLFLFSRWLPPVVLLILFLGVSSADRTIKSKNKHYEFTLTGSVVEGTLLRTFEKYFLVWNAKDNTYEFIKSSLVKSFKPKAEPKAAVKI